MKIHGSEAKAEREVSGLGEDEESQNMNKGSKIQMIRNKALKRCSSGEGPQQSVKKGENAKDFKDGTTNQQEEDCSHIQG